MQAKKTRIGLGIACNPYERAVERRARQQPRR